MSITSSVKERHSLLNQKKINSEDEIIEIGEDEISPEKSDNFKNKKRKNDSTEISSESLIPSKNSNSDMEIVENEQSYSNQVKKKPGKERKKKMPKDVDSIVLEESDDENDIKEMKDSNDVKDNKSTKSVGKNNKKKKNAKKKIHKVEEEEGKISASDENEKKIEQNEPQANEPKEPKIDEINEQPQVNEQIETSPQFVIINKIIEEFGIEKMLESLCKPKLDENDKLDTMLKGVSDSSNGINFLFLRTFFLYFKSKFDEIEKLLSFKEDKSVVSVKEEPEKDEVQENKNIMSIGSHYHKSEEGLIFKYKAAFLDGKGFTVFKCYDEKCDSEAMYELETKKFTITKEHSLNHSEHDYIKNLENNCDYVFNDLMKNSKSEAQVFKENGERVVKIY